LFDEVSDLCTFLCRQFGQFDYSQTGSYDASLAPEPAAQPQQQNPYAGSILTPAAETFNTYTPPTGESFEDEPPLMEGWLLGCDNTSNCHNVILSVVI